MDNLNLEILEQIISESLDEGKKEISMKDLEEKYLIKQKALEKYIEIKKRVQQKIEDIIRICLDNGLARNVYSAYTGRYAKIITSQKTNKKGKVIELSELELDVDNTIENLNEIIKLVSEINEKIKQIKENYKYDMSNISWYQENNSSDLTNELKKIISPKNDDFTQIKENLQELSNKVDTIILSIDSLKKISKYRVPTPSMFNEQEYRIEGITVKVNLSEKTYEIVSTDKMIGILKECKMTKFLKILEKKIQSVPFKEIIEPKYVNEKKLAEFLKKGILPIETILKFDISNLIKHLGLDTKMRKIPTQKELSENSEVIKIFFDFIKVMNANGFKANIKKGNNIFEEIITQYQKISIESNEDIYMIIEPIIHNRYKDNLFVYSSLQNVYNCIDSELRKSIHKELASKKTTKPSKELKEVFEFLRKYAKNKDGKPYPDDEIQNFLKQKTIAATSFYPVDGQAYREYQEVLDNEYIQNYAQKLIRRQ